MVSRNNRDAKADATHVAAKKIVEAERSRLRVKTDRLRALRLARQDGGEVSESAPPRKK
jgi:hypothetical protein